MEFGMSPMDPIRSATLVADMFDEKGGPGVIAPSAYAYIVAVSGDL
jgi:hypothetical protein